MDRKKQVVNQWVMGLGAAAALSCGTGTTCVAKGTLVTTPTGRRRVEELAVGDEVMAVDPNSGEAKATLIIQIRSSMRECGMLGLGRYALTATPDHPLFDPTDRAFHPAGDWMLGLRTQLLAFDAMQAQPVEVQSRQTFVGVREVFDLSVECEWHTFIAEGIVVHNKEPAPCAIPDGGSTQLTIGAENRPVCTCTDGKAGRWTCEQSGGIATCSLCGQDAGP